MIKSLIIAAAAFTSTAAAAAPFERTFTADGKTYAYSAENDTAGRIVLTGRNMTTGASFRYLIDGQQVTGFTGNEPVSFRIAKPIGNVTMLAAAR